MDLSDATAWWIAAGVLVALELATGTFYLLMLAVGTLAAALAAHAGMPFNGQLVAAAAVGGGAVAFWYRRNRDKAAAAPAAANRDVNLDIGTRVTVEQWSANGTARINYRGAAWDVQFAGPGAPQPGEHVIHAIEGSRLLLARVAS